MENGGNLNSMMMNPFTMLGGLGGLGGMSAMGGMPGMPGMGGPGGGMNMNNSMLASMWMQGRGGMPPGFSRGAMEQVKINFIYNVTGNNRTF